MATDSVDETQLIHHALHELAMRVLPQYEADEGPLTTAQMRHFPDDIHPRPKPRPALIAKGLAILNR